MSQNSRGSAVLAAWRGGRRLALAPLPASCGHRSGGTAGAAATGPGARRACGGEAPGGGPPARGAGQKAALQPPSGGTSCFPAGDPRSMLSPRPARGTGAAWCWGGCSWFSATPRSQPPAGVCLSSSSASPGSTLGAHRAHLCRACGETEARGMAWQTRGRARIQVLRPRGRAVPPIHAGRGPMPAPFPRAGCVPVPAAGQLGCPRTQLGCTALPGSCRAP